MPTIRRFEDIHAWEKAREVVKKVYSLTGRGNFARDYALRDQLRRAATSIMLNIAEGHGRKTDKEFRQFLVHARGSAAEAQSALYIALDQGYLTQPQFSDLYSALEEVSRMISAFSSYLGRHVPTSNPPARRLEDYETRRLED